MITNENGKYEVQFNFAWEYSYCPCVYGSLLHEAACKRIKEILILTSMYACT